MSTKPETFRYVGGDERVFPGWLSVDDDGEVTTLIGIPGGEPVAIQQAAGGVGAPLDDHLWVPETPATKRAATKADAAAEVATKDEEKGGN
jgi:hypothetical protein